LIGEFEAVIEKLRLWEVVDANARLGRALDGIQIVSSTTGMIERHAGFDTRDGEFNGLPVTESLKRIEPIFEDMLSAQQQQDWILLADLIEYELVPYFRDRVAILNTWSEKAHA
jgi:hypothetical protein